MDATAIQNWLKSIPNLPMISRRKLDTSTEARLARSEGLACSLFEADSSSQEASMKIHEIPGVVLVEWNDESKTVVDTWSSYMIQVPQFREAILTKGIEVAQANKARAWIVDSSKAKGAFRPEVQTLIEAEVFKEFAAIGIKVFITVKSSSAITNMAMNRVTANLGPFGIQMVDVPDLQAAIAWLKAHP